MKSHKEPEFFGQEAILKSGKCGMPTSHLTALQEVANTLNQPILIRPVSIYARYFLEHGCPSKPFSIKIKSSPRGPMAGLLSIDPKYGRCKNEKEAKKHHEDLQHAFDVDATLTPTHLYLTLERINELQKEPLNALKATHSDDKSIRLQWSNNGEEYTGTAIYDPKKQMYQIWDDAKPTAQPIQVLGKQLNQELILPITADYDLFLVPPSFAEFDPGLQDQTPHRVQNRDIKDVRSSVLNPQLNKEKEGKGNISPRLDMLLTVLNNTIARHDIHRQKVRKIKNKVEEKVKPIALKAFWQAKSPLNYTIHLHSMQGEGPFSSDTFDIKTSETPLPLLLKYTNKKNNRSSFYFYQSINDKINMTEVNLNDLKTLNFDKEQFREIRKTDKSISTVEEKENNILYNRLAYKEYHLRSLNPAMFKDSHISIQPGLEVIHHNQEMQSPFAENLEGNLPLLAILPPYGENKEGAACLATDKSQVRWIWDHLQNQGFYLTTPKQYAASLPKFRNPISEEDLKEVIKAKKDREAQFDDKKTTPQPQSAGAQIQTQPIEPTMIAVAQGDGEQEPVVAPGGVQPTAAAADGKQEPPPAPDGKQEQKQHQRFASAIPLIQDHKHHRFASSALKNKTQELQEEKISKLSKIQVEKIDKLKKITKEIEQLNVTIRFMIKKEQEKPTKEGLLALNGKKDQANACFKKLEEKINRYKKIIPQKELVYFTQLANNLRADPWIDSPNKPPQSPTPQSDDGLRSKSPKR